MNFVQLRRVHFALLAILSMTFDFSGNARAGELWGINLKLMGGPLELRIAPRPTPGVHEESEVVH